MKKILILFLMLSTLSFSEVVKAKVVAVYGGDSFQVLIGNKKQTVKLYEITAPSPKEIWGSKSKESLSLLLLNKNVSLEIKSQNSTGMSAIVYVGNENVNMKMINSGNVKFIGKDSKFNEAQNKAKKNGKALWAEKKEKEVKKPKVKGNKNSKENEFDMNDKKERN